MVCCKFLPQQVMGLFVLTVMLAGLAIGPCHGKDDPEPEWRPKPGDHYPYGFTLQVLGGKNFTLSNDTIKDGPIIFNVYDPEDAYSRWMWRSDDSVQDFLSRTPARTRYLFFTYGEEPMLDAQYFKKRLEEGLQALNVSSNEIPDRMQQFYFSTANMASVSDQGANFLPYLLDHWNSPRRQLLFNASDGWELKSTRLNADFDWLPFSPPLTFTPLANFGDGCSDVEPFSLTGKVAFIIDTDSPQDNAPACSYATMIQKAQAANASAVIISSVPGQDVVKMECENVKECEIPLNISATQIPYTVAVQVRDALSRGPVTVNYTVPDGGGFWAAVDEQGLLQQVGWEKFPTLMHLAWAAQWFEYTTELQNNLTKPALVVPVFRHQAMAGESGLVGNITLPSKEELEGFDIF
eukprot:jgi/Botrbrau1/12599/Bobra.0169s0127.1